MRRELTRGPALRATCRRDTQRQIDCRRRLLNGDLFHAARAVERRDAAPTGRAVRIEGATFTRLNDAGLVSEDVHLSDIAGLLAQLSG